MSFFLGFADELVKKAELDTSIIPILAALGGAAGAKYGGIWGLLESTKGRRLKGLLKGMGSGALTGGAMGAAGGAYASRGDISKSLERSGAI